MSQYARVNSVVLLKSLKASLATFSDAAAVALDEVSTDVQRTLAWLNEDRKRYWSNQVHVCAERVTQAKLALKQKNVLDRALSGTTSRPSRKGRRCHQPNVAARAQAKLAATRRGFSKSQCCSRLPGGVQGPGRRVDAISPTEWPTEKMIDSWRMCRLGAARKHRWVRKGREEVCCGRPPGPPDLRAFRKTSSQQDSCPHRRTAALAALPEWITGIAMPEASLETSPVLPRRRIGFPDPCVAGSPRCLPCSHHAADGDSDGFVGAAMDRIDEYVPCARPDLLQRQPQLQKCWPARRVSG